MTPSVDDNDPVRFWTYVALWRSTECAGGLGRGALQRLRTPSGRWARERGDRTVERRRDTRRSAHDRARRFPVRDRSQAPRSRSTMRSSACHLTTRLIVMTRSDPSLNLSRLRDEPARSPRFERARLALPRFEEASEILIERGRFSLWRPHEVEVLHERTEGWPGAIYLASLWLHGLENPHDAVREFGGDHRFVAEYLNHEILGSLDEDVALVLVAYAWSSGSSPPISATACSTGPTQRPRSRSWSTRTSSSPGSSTEDGSVSIRCSPSLQSPSSRHAMPGASVGDPSARPLWFPSNDGFLRRCGRARRSLHRLRGAADDPSPTITWP